MLLLFAMIFPITRFFKRSISTSCPSVVALCNSCEIFRSFFLSQTIDDPNIMGGYVLSQLLFKNGTVPLTTSGILRWGNHGNICLFFFFTTCINGVLVSGYDVAVPYYVNDLLFGLEIPKSDGLTKWQWVGASIYVDKGHQQGIRWSYL